MNCVRCGTPIPEESPACPSCGLAKYQQQGSYTPPPPPPPPQSQGTYAPPPPPLPGAAAGGAPVNTYLIPSIIVTLCCCLPLGIVAIVFAAQSSSKLSAGDLNGARESASRAKLFFWLALVLGIIANIVIILLYGAAGFFEALKHTSG